MSKNTEVVPGLRRIHLPRKTGCETIDLEIGKSVYLAAAGVCRGIEAVVGLRKAIERSGEGFAFHDLEGSATRVCLA